MYDEIAFKNYLSAVGRMWRWLLAGALVAGIIGAVVSALWPDDFEARALISVSEPRYSLQFDPRLQTSSGIQSVSAYAELALSDAVMAMLLEEIEPRPPEIAGLDSLRRRASANQGADSTILRLTITLPDPEIAASVVNTWAEVLIEHVNERFGFPGAQQVDFFRVQVEDARSELSLAEDRLLTFQEENRIQLLSNEIEALSQQQLTYLEDRVRLGQLRDDIEGMGLVGENLLDGSTPLLSDQLTVLYLQLATFETELDLPLQLAVEPENGFDAGDLDARLRTLDLVLETQLSNVEARLDAIEPQLLRLQVERQELLSTERRLENERVLAEETYLTLSRKLDEALIASQDMVQPVALAAPAVPPREPNAINPALAAVVGGMAGLILAAGIVSIWLWWREPQQVESLSQNP